MTELAKYRKALMATFKNNKQLIIGVSIGALIMLPTGLYINEKANNSQKPQGGTTTIPLLTDNVSNTKTSTATTVPSVATPSPSQSRGTGSSKPTTYTPTPPTAPTNTSTYKPPVCTKSIAPYTTTIQIASYLGGGSTNVHGGIDGYTETCTADSAGFVPRPVPLNPYNKIIYVGTGGVTATTPPRTSQPEADQLDRIKTNCGLQLSIHGNQEAYNLCVSILARYFNIQL